MSLLSQFGIEPIKRKSAKNHIGQPYFTISFNGKNNSYSLGLASFLTAENLDWEGIDIAFSKPHGGIVIAKGTTFDFQKKEGRIGRIDSKDIFELIFNSFCLKKPKTYARVLFTYEMYSQDVYIFKLDSINYN